MVACPSRPQIPCVPFHLARLPATHNYRVLSPANGPAAILLFIFAKWRTPQHVFLFLLLFKGTGPLVAFERRNVLVNDLFYTLSFIYTNIRRALHCRWSHYFTIIFEYGQVNNSMCVKQFSVLNKLLNVKVYAQIIYNGCQKDRIPRFSENLH